MQTVPVTIRTGGFDAPVFPLPQRITGGTAQCLKFSLTVSPISNDEGLSVGTFSDFAGHHRPQIMESVLTVNNCYRGRRPR